MKDVQLAWETNVQDLSDVLSAMRPLASVKDAGAVRFISNDGRVTVSVTSPAGKLQRELKVRAASKHEPVGCGYAVLNDMVQRIGKEQPIKIMLEKGVSNRIVLRTPSATYVMLTKGE